MTAVRKAVTEKHWPAETPEEVVERTRREHGDAVADLVAKALGWEPKRKKQPPKRVGVKPKRSPAIPARPSPRLSRAEVRDKWAHGFNESNRRAAAMRRAGTNRSGLPSSGAGPVRRP